MTLAGQLDFYHYQECHELKGGVVMISSFFFRLTRIRFLCHLHAAASARKFDLFTGCVAAVYLDYGWHDVITLLQFSSHNHHRDPLTLRSIPQYGNCRVDRSCVLNKNLDTYFDVKI